MLSICFYMIVANILLIQKNSHPKSDKARRLGMEISKRDPSIDLQELYRRWGAFLSDVRANLHVLMALLFIYYIDNVAFLI